MDLSFPEVQLANIPINEPPSFASPELVPNNNNIDEDSFIDLSSAIRTQRKWGWQNIIAE